MAAEAMSFRSFVRMQCVSAVLMSCGLMLACGFTGVGAAALNTVKISEVLEKPPAPPPGPVPSVAFSAGFASDMVLQHGVANAVYGTTTFAASRISVTVTSPSTPAFASYTVIASVQPGVDTSVWRAVLKPSPASLTDEYTISVVCTAGCTGNTTLDSVVAERVVYGDVYYCSGQSNMALSLHFTYSADVLQADVLAGKYPQIRTFQYGDMGGGPFVHSDGPKYATTDGAVPWYNLSYAASINSTGKKDLNPFESFSATCTYFAVGLADLGTSTPIGLIQAAVGGTQIEAWLDNETLTTCTNESGYNFNASGANIGYAITSKLFYGMVTPFINTSVAGWIWYQGENNCHGVMGNSATKSGYGCDQVALVASWRRHWSEASSTAPLAPFGLVTLASGGSEGAGDHMAGMRWSQTGNFGALPNPVMPNTFLAQGYDIGDPWAYDSSSNCSHPDLPQGPDCLPWDTSGWNPSVRPLAPLVRNNSAPYFMGPIHPRFKHEVGRRLAVAHLKNVSGPTIAGCARSDQAKTLTIKIDASRLGGEDIVVQPFDTDVSKWSGIDSSSLMVCTNAMGPSMANESSCACSSWAYIRVPCDRPGCNKTEPGADRALWYCEVGPPGMWKPTVPPHGLTPTKRLETEDVAAGVGDGLGWVPGRNPYEAIWVPAPVAKGMFANDGSPTVVADLSGVNGTVLAVRYGWPFSGDTCCPWTTVSSGLEVCKPAACPVLSSATNLPMNPFFASVVNDKCKCIAPQTCAE